MTHVRHIEDAHGDLVDALAEQAAAIGAVHGRGSAEWWAMEAIGGRASGDVAMTARWALAGISDGDGVVTDSFPSPDLSGEWADGYTPRRLADELGIRDDDDSLDSLCDSYCDAFEQACQDEIERQCRFLLDNQEV